MLYSYQTWSIKIVFLTHCPLCFTKIYPRIIAVSFIEFAKSYAASWFFSKFLLIEPELLLTLYLKHAGAFLLSVIIILSFCCLTFRLSLSHIAKIRLCYEIRNYLCAFNIRLTLYQFYTYLYFFVIFT